MPTLETPDGEPVEDLPRCGKPRLVPVWRRVGLYLVSERCQRSKGHGGKCCVYWRADADA